MGRTFRLSRPGRRTTAILMLAVISLAAFAAWMLRRTAVEGITPANLVPAGLLAIILVASPAVLWTLYAELAMRVVLSPEGLAWRAPGLDVQLRWHELARICPDPDGEDEDRIDFLATRPDPLAACRLPLRLLYRQAFGPRRLPLYGALAEREALVSEIFRRTAAQAAAEPGDDRSEL